jgi:hypothetical protein
MAAGVYAAGGNHSTAAYVELATMHPEAGDLYFPLVQIYNCMPIEIAVKLAVEHNDTNEFRKKNTYTDKLLHFREMYEADGFVWSVESRKLAALSAGAKNDRSLKSLNEFFQVSQKPASV